MSVLIQISGISDPNRLVGRLYPFCLLWLAHSLPQLQETAVARMGVRFATVVLALLASAASPAQAQVITNIVRGGSPNTGMMLPPVVVQGGMNPGALTYVDRVHVYATDVPTFLRGLDYVRSANDDRTVADYTLDVTLRVPSTLYLFIDNRVGDGSNANPPTLGGTVMPWVAASGFTATTTQFGIDEGNDGTVNQFFTIYTRDVAAGTIRLSEQNAPGHVRPCCGANRRCAGADFSGPVRVELRRSRLAGATARGTRPAG
jgi:hypothetical protein